MPLMVLVIVVALPLADIYATFRLASWLNVPVWLMFIPGMLLGLHLMQRESRLLQVHFRAALTDLSLPRKMLDSGRRMVAGLLLLLPGLVSDMIGLSLLLIPYRSQTATVAVPRGHRPAVDADYRRID